jgi:restriction system protein
MQAVPGRRLVGSSEGLLWRVRSRTDKGLIITTGTFSSEAKREATRDGAPPIELIDGDYLCELLKQNKLGVVTELVERVMLDPAWFSDL